MSFESAPGLWTLADLCEAVGVKPVLPDCDIGRLVFDSRTVEVGDLFIALPGGPGSARDGHDFVDGAREKGAAAALVHKAVQLTGPLPLIEVPDTYKALWEIGAASRARLSAIPVAITGSSGKTTAKAFMTAALGAFAPPGSYNNHIGVPLALAHTPLDAEYGVYEIGTNHPGEIGPLARLVAPEVAVLLNVQSAHIENFTSHEALLREKASIFEGLQGMSIRIIDHALQERGLEGYTFGWARDADARLLELEGTRAEVSLFGERLVAHVPGGGPHRAATVACVLLAARLLGEDLTRGLNLPGELVPEGRGNLVSAQGITLVDESYNANPDSMQAALTSALNLPVTGRRYALVGEMLELGDAGVSAHQGLGDTLSAFDAVYCVGAGFREVAEDAGIPWRLDVAGEEGAAWLNNLIAILQPGDLLVVKGSNTVFWQRGTVGYIRDQIGSKN